MASSLSAGVVSQQLSNEPDAPFDGPTRHMARLPALFAAAYPPAGSVAAPPAN